MGEAEYYKFDNFHCGGRKGQYILNEKSLICDSSCGWLMKSEKDGVGLFLDDFEQWISVYFSSNFKLIFCELPVIGREFLKH